MGRSPTSPSPPWRATRGASFSGPLAGTPVVAMQGRFHLYEGYDLQKVTFPVRVMRLLGAEVLVVSGACGGMNPHWNPGELVLLDDHINLLGDNPLVGPNLDELGPRFPDMSEPLTGDSRTLARRCAAEAGIPLRRGSMSPFRGRTWKPGPSTGCFGAWGRCRRDVHGPGSHRCPAHGDAGPGALHHYGRLSPGFPGAC